jgi:hypothetical protein
MRPFRLVSLVLSLCLATLLPRLDAAGLSGTHYYRHLVFNHDSPNIAYAGVYEIDEATAKTTAHYQFTYDEEGRIAEILNYSPEDWHHHALTHLGAFRTSYTYEGNKEIRRFFDTDGKRVPNLRTVYEEVYTKDRDGFKTSLEFFDLNGKPMESNWNISRYTWEKKGDLIIERRYNLKGDLMPLSPYFQFRISGIKYDADGHFAIHYNLNDRLEVTENADGIASYRDLYAANGNLLGLGYFNKRDELIPSPWKYALIELSYDANGNVVGENGLDEKGGIVMRNTFRYDDMGKQIVTK